jgi:hypothetical protein
MTPYAIALTKYGTRRTIEERRIDDIRVMDTPRKFHPLFGDENMDKIASFLKVGRNHPKLANWMWEFVYHTLNVERNGRSWTISTPSNRTGTGNKLFTNGWKRTQPRSTNNILIKS